MKFNVVGCLLLATLLSSCVLSQPIKSPSFGRPPLRILTLGDSITAIFRYQPYLRERLKKEGVDAVFVGSEGKDGNKHEGHSGWSIGQIEEKATQYISDSDADVVLLQIGVNNMNHGLGLKGKDYPPYQDGAQAQGAKKGKTLDELGASWGDKTYGSGYLAARVNGLLDKILTHPNQPFLVVAKIPGVGLGNPRWKAENDDADARVREFNTILESAVKARKAKGLKVEVVDNYAPGNRAYGNGPGFTWGDEAQQSGDWVHPRPDAAAWRGMATNFAAGLRRLIKR
jgi:GDSL-like lipase/acylhydrolase family protein